VTIWAQESFRLSLRRACRIIGTARSAMLYRSVRPQQEPLRRRIREIAHTRVSYGHRRVHVLLRREGWKVNMKRVYRLYREEGLSLRTKKPKRRRAAQPRQERPAGTLPNERWSMDFMSDALADGRKIRVLTVIDTCTRECVALEVATSFRGSDVAQVLTRVGIQRGLPTTITVDNGTEFTSKALDHWAYKNRLKLDYTRPGKPTDNGFIESFNAAVRRECLSQHYFSSVVDARDVIAAWRDEYNHRRPHGSLGQRTPTEVGAQARADMTQESRSIAIIEPGASCEAASEPDGSEIPEDRERLALREA
jgi:putative transposase